MVPVFVQKIPFNQAISERFFGKNKTWRGLFFGILSGGLVFWLQQILYKEGFRSLAVIDYADFTIALGFLLAAGALLGDLVKSYYKRKHKIPPGKSWFPFDQIDFVIGGIALSLLVYVPSVEVVALLLLISPLLHVVVNYIGFLLGIRKSWI